MILMMTMVINIRRVARNAPHPVGHVNLAGEHQRAAQQCHIFQREDCNCDDSDHYHHHITSMLMRVMVFILIKVMMIILIMMPNNKEHVSPYAFQIADSETCLINMVDC